MNNITIAVWLAGAAGTFCLAASGGTSGSSEQGASASSEAQVLKMQERMREIQRQQLEALKEKNPQAYEEQERLLEQQEKINKVMEKFRKGAIKEEEAEKQLFPLIKDSMKPELESLKDRIARLEKQLAALKAAEKDPDILVQQRVEIMLGKRQPERGGPMW